MRPTIISAVALLAAATALGAPSPVLLHPGQSKKVGHSTVACTTGHGTRTSKRIVLSVGSQVKVDGILVRCASTSTPAAKGTRASPFPIGLAGSAPGAPSSPESSWAITVRSVNPNAWTAVEAANMFNDPPPSGSVDVMVSLKVAFTGTQPGDTLDLTPFLDAVGASGVSYGASQDCGVLPSPSEFDYGSLSPGAAFNLNDCWQVAQSDVRSLEMVWAGGSTPGPFWALH
jgi:hypothetical protein